MEPLDLQKTKSSGLINWVTEKDIEAVTQELAKLAQDKVSKLDMLDDAEKRIEKRLNDALLPRLVNYRFTHQVRFHELTLNIPNSEDKESNNKSLETMTS